MSSDQVKCAAIAANCACFNVRKASRAITQLYDEALVSCGLTVTQFTLLVAVNLAGESTLTRLADLLVMDRTTLTRNLVRLEKEALVQTGAGRDHRTRVIALTARGRSVLRKAIPLWEKAQSRVVKGLSEERWENLRTGLSAAVALSRR